MRALKTLLTLMGIVIMAGFAFIGWEVYQRATDPDHPRAFSRELERPPEVAPTLPAGSRIGQMLVQGTRIVYHVTLPDGTEQIHVLDPREGTVTVPVTIPAAAQAGTVPMGPGTADTVTPSTPVQP